MIERDDADDLGRTLVDELMTELDQKIFDRYLERQLVPYTLHSVLNEALDIVDVRTLHHVLVLNFTSIYNTCLTVQAAI